MVTVQNDIKIHVHVLTETMINSVIDDEMTGKSVQAVTGIETETMTDTEIETDTETGGTGTWIRRETRAGTRTGTEKGIETEETEETEEIEIEIGTETEETEEIEIGTEEIETEITGDLHIHENEDLSRCLGSAVGSQYSAHLLQR